MIQKGTGGVLNSHRQEILVQCKIFFRIRKDHNIEVQMEIPCWLFIEVKIQFRKRCGLAKGLVLSTGLYGNYLCLVCWKLNCFHCGFPRWSALLPQLTGAHLQAAWGSGTLCAVPWRTEGAAEDWGIKQKKKYLLQVLSSPLIAFSLSFWSRAGWHLTVKSYYLIKKADSGLWNYLAHFYLINCKR